VLSKPLWESAFRSDFHQRRQFPQGLHFFLFCSFFLSFCGRCTPSSAIDAILAFTQSLEGKGLAPSPEEHPVRRNLGSPS
jgi:hypothetical protein